MTQKPPHHPIHTGGGAVLCPGRWSGWSGPPSGAMRSHDARPIGPCRVLTAISTRLGSQSCHAGDKDPAAPRCSPSSTSNGADRRRMGVSERPPSAVGETGEWSAHDAKNRPRHHEVTGAVRSWTTWVRGYACRAWDGTGAGRRFLPAASFEHRHGQGQASGSSPRRIRSSSAGTDSPRRRKV
jgi:hypothetical protein